MDFRRVPFRSTNAVFGFDSLILAAFAAASNAAAFEAAAKAAKIKLSKPKTAFVVEGDDRVGALASVMRRLGDAKINVTAVSGVCAGMSRYGAIFWVKPRDVAKAASAVGAL